MRHDSTTMTGGLAAGLLLCLALVGCAPSNTVASPSFTGAVTPASTEQIPSSAPPTVPLLPSTPSVAPTPTDIDLALDVHSISGDFTHDVFYLKSLGVEVIWAAEPPGGDGGGRSTLYRYRPTESSPEVVYAETEPDWLIAWITGSAAGYVFSEYAAGSGPYIAWRVLYVRQPNDKPIILDEDLAEENIWPPMPPTVAMNDTHIAWAPTHLGKTHMTSEVRVVDVERPGEPLTLRSVLAPESRLELPALFGNELWYGLSENDWENYAAYPHVEKLDLSRPDQPPDVFGVDERAYMPAANADAVIWAGGGLEGMNAWSDGKLTILWRDSGVIETLKIPGDRSGPLSSSNVTFPSVGNRFVAWQDAINQRFYVYDLRAKGFRRIAGYELTSSEGAGNQHISGNLITWLYVDLEGQTTLRWAHLPD